MFNAIRIEIAPHIGQKLYLHRDRYNKRRWHVMTAGGAEASLFLLFKAIPPALFALEDAGEDPIKILSAVRSHLKFSFPARLLFPLISQENESHVDH